MYMSQCLQQYSDVTEWQTTFFYFHSNIPYEKILLMDKVKLGRPHHIRVIRKPVVHWSSASSNGGPCSIISTFTFCQDNWTWWSWGGSLLCSWYDWIHVAHEWSRNSDHLLIIRSLDSIGSLYEYLNRNRHRLNLSEANYYFFFAFLGS